MLSKEEVEKAFGNCEAVKEAERPEGGSKRVGFTTSLAENRR